MNQLLLRKEINPQVTKQQFFEDIDCLMQNLKDTYAMYDYFSNDAFQRANQRMKERISEDFNFEKSIEILKEELSFAKDGHFYIGLPRKYVKCYDYAVKYTIWHGIDMIDCKKFYYDSDEEKEQLEKFANQAVRYHNEDPLIIDLRDNEGGSTTYIYDFLKILLEQEIGYSFKYLQKNSQLFKDYLSMQKIDWDIEKMDDEVQEEYCSMIKNRKPIYVFFNENSGSAAEEGIAYLKNIENVTLVGTHSAGCASCGNCITIYLPNSHVQVYFGTGLVLYDGYRNVDAEGGFKGDMSYEEFEMKFQNS